MSSPVIPSADQVAAARLSLWHQNSAPSDPSGILPPDSTTPGSIAPDATTQNSNTQDATTPDSTTADPSVHDASAEEAAAPDPSADPSSGVSGEPSPAAAPVPHNPPSSVALLTAEALRTWLNSAGLVLFAPRPQHLPAPAPSLVEATLGHPSPNPTLAETELARTLLARLIADGSAIPLSLLGTPTGAVASPFGPDTPDFVASSSVFSYVFTLRGDKIWKQPPTTSGPSKVSPLSLNAFTLLVEQGSLSAYDLATHLGKEVTEAAVLRSLVELWSHLRVFPIPQLDGRPTLWEPASARLTKQIKAGANAGQPSALSALISLYLGQAILATEDEIETFLSPLAPRSRIREVTHALMGARQLDTLAIDGRNLLHVAGDLPASLTGDAEISPSPAHAAATLEPQLGPDGEPLRIKKFIPKPRKIGTGFAARPVRPAAPGADRERRPFQRDAASRPSFTHPWDENKPRREAPGQSEGLPAEASSSDTRPDRPFPRKPPFAGRPSNFSDRKPNFSDRKSSFSDRKPGFGNRPPPREGSRPSFGANTFGSKPRFGQNARPPREDAAGGSRPSFSGRPSFRDRPDAGSRPPRREFSPRPSSPRPERPESQEGQHGREGFANRDPFHGPARPDANPRSTFGARPFTPKPFGSKPYGSKPFTPKPFGSKPYGGKPGFAGKPRFDRDAGAPPHRDFGMAAGASDSRPPRREFQPGRPSPGGFDRPRKPFAPRQEGDRPARPAFRKFDAPRGPRPTRTFDASAGPRPRPDGDAATPPRSGGFPRKPGGFSAKSGGPPGAKPFRKPGRFTGDAPGANTFDKFKGGKKPFGKRPPARKWKPE